MKRAWDQNVISRGYSDTEYADCTSANERTSRLYFICLIIRVELRVRRCPEHGQVDLKKGPSSAVCESNILCRKQYVSHQNDNRQGNETLAQHKL